MGYDMHWVRKDPEEERLVSEATREFNAAVKIRDTIPRQEHGHLDPERANALGLDWDDPEALVDASDRYKAAQQAVHNAYEKMYLAERSYFRLNIWGMGAARRVMYAAKMIFDDDPDPDWPKAANFGITEGQAYAHRDPEDYPEETLTEDEHAKAEEYWTAIDNVRRYHGSEQLGIPSRKFGSNDGWVVTPPEALAAVALWRDFEKEFPMIAERIVEKELNAELWERWLIYLEESAQHEGFKVW